MELKRIGAGVVGANVVVLNLAGTGEGVLNLAGAGVEGLNKKLGVEVENNAGAGAGVVGVGWNLLVGTTGATVGIGGKGANLAGVNNCLFFSVFKSSSSA